MFNHGCNRSCSLDYLDDPCVDSKSSNSILFCYCVLLLLQKKKKNLNTFVNVSSTSYLKINDRKLTHVEQNYHRDIIAKVQNLFHCPKIPQGTINYHADNFLCEGSSVYPKILEVIARAIHFQGK